MIKDPILNEYYQIHQILCSSQFLVNFSSNNNNLENSHKIKNFIYETIRKIEFQYLRNEYSVTILERAHSINNDTDRIMHTM